MLSATPMESPPDPLLCLAIGIGGILFLGCIFWPRVGLIGCWQRFRTHSLRVACEDALKHIEKVNLDGRRPTLQSLGGALQTNLNQVARVVEELVKRELVVFESVELQLTPSGRAYALNIIRAHRLWEHYLSEKTGVAELEWHDRAEAEEHHLSPIAANALAVQLGHPTHDPHGDPIPSADGVLRGQKGEPLASIPAGKMGRIVHIEDEPAAVYSQLVAQGLSLGMTVRLNEVTPQLVRFSTGEQERVLPAIVAGNLFVRPLSDAETAETVPNERLSMLSPGEAATVHRISLRCRGAERRRLVGLGILPGTLITAETVSPSGDPTAYRIRGAVIALRKEQAELIETTRAQELAVA